MNKKVLIIASSGGHWLQILRLRPAFSGHDTAFASTFPGNKADVSEHRFHAIKDSNRNSLFRVPGTVWSVLRVLWSERPDVIVTTGALPGLIALGLGKHFFRAKTIWVDSIANAEKVSGSGRIAAWFSDLCLTQWHHLAEDAGMEYWGAVL